MAPTRRNPDGLIARVNFPLYTVRMLTSRHVLVGGGGGSSKTGVANGFEVYELSHDGVKFLAEEVVRHETGPSAVMTCSTFNDGKRTYVVAGQESYCQVYNVNSVIVTEDDDIETIGDHEVRKRRNVKADNNRNSKKLKFAIKPADSVKTDFEDQEPLLRVIRISHLGNLMATGGTDGHLRLWKFPSLQPSHVLKAHNKEIDDIDFSQHNNFIISIAKDGDAILWDYVKGKQVRKLTWSQPEGSKYLYKRCRFGIIEGEKDKSALYMLANPMGLAKKQKAYLQRWVPEEGTLAKVAVVDESLSALAVRDDGRFVALGTMFSGSVSIYIAFSLQSVLHIPNTHSMFVTGLEFLPVATDSHTITSIAEAAVVSISVDNQVCIHSLSYRRTIPPWLAISVIILTLFLTFVLCSYLGL